MLDLRTAVTRILAGAAPLPAEHVALTAAEGRMLAGDVRARAALPAWDNSAMDGYAVRAADVSGASADAPVRLTVIETVAAGGVARLAVGAAQATRIMTGAPMPAGADCVVRVEDTDDGREVVTVHRDRDAGRNVRPAGEDVRAGAVALTAGTLLGGAQLAFLASTGERTVAVRRRPRVAILASGDELVPLDRAGEPLPAGSLFATNSLALGALLRADGAEPVDLGIAADSPASIADRAAGAAGCDLLVTTGGASVGDHDHARRALAAHGLALDFWRVRVRPGAQTAFGRLRTMDRMPWLGLPGNPVSAQVTYELFVRPLVRLWLGHPLPFRALLPVTLHDTVTSSERDCLLLRVRLAVDDDGRLHARLTGPQGSNLLHSMAHADALLVLPAGGGTVVAGTAARALPLGGAFHVAAVPR
ncbi:MAG: molybdopterin molybdotransferase MoeA [Gemmatimonadaceae bacterium]